MSLASFAIAEGATSQSRAQSGPAVKTPPKRKITALADRTVLIAEPR